MTVVTKCDFCSAPEPEWVYPARNVEVDLLGGEVGESLGAWTACELCADLIERDQRVALARRAIAHGPSRHMPLTRAQRQQVEDAVLDMHKRFFSSRTAARRHFG